MPVCSKCLETGFWISGVLQEKVPKVWGRAAEGSLDRVVLKQTDGVVTLMAEDDLSLQGSVYIYERVQEDTEQ